MSLTTRRMLCLVTLIHLEIKLLNSGNCKSFKGIIWLIKVCEECLRNKLQTIYQVILVWGPRPLIPSPCVHSLPLSHFHTHIKTKYNIVIIYYRGYIIINAPVKYFPPFKYLTKWQHKTRASKQKTDLNTPVIGPTAHNTPHNYINISTLSVIPNISPLTLHL